MRAQIQVDGAYSQRGMQYRPELVAQLMIVAKWYWSV